MSYFGPMSMERWYDVVLRRHLSEVRQMAFVTGPRQVGKTTSTRGVATHYHNWDIMADRRLIQAGQEALAQYVGLTTLQENKPIIALDEIHKFSRWKNWLKGFFDAYADRSHILVTGSARLDVYRRGGDSLMGRYFLYRMHPLSVGELVSPHERESFIRPPQALDEIQWQSLWEHGGFPEPFIQRKGHFTRRWRSLRLQQFVQEDIRDSTRIQDMTQIAHLAEILCERSSQQIVMNHLAQDIQVSPDTLKRWLHQLSSLYLGHLIRPWFKNVTKAIRKEPKWLLYDWSGISDVGSRAETFIGGHLLKAVDGWTDLGLANCELFYLRDKMQREVDFLVVKDKKPWFLVEVKHKPESISKALSYYQNQLRVPHAFQVVIDMDYVQADCFAKNEPIQVPARTLLSQLL
jgi:uncharacterized protein